MRCARALVGIAAGLIPVFASAANGEPLLSPVTLGLLAAMGIVGVAIAALSLRRDHEAAPDVPPAGVDIVPTDAARLRHFVGGLPNGASTTASKTTAEPMPAVVRTRRHGIVAQPLAADTVSAVADTARARPADQPKAHDIAVAARDAANTADLVRVPSGAADAADVYATAPTVLPFARTDHTRPSFLALHHVDLSIDVLRQHLAEEARPMPAVWVMLLDLCRTHGREATFREIAAEFHAQFNVCAPSWDAYPPDRDEPGLEAYPRIVRELTQAWGTHECRRLLDRLLYDNRNGERRGFTLNAYNDLIALRRAADVVLDTIEQDCTEEARVRDAFAHAAMEARLPDTDDEASAPRASPLTRDLEATLDADVRELGETRSALEREHPAFADILVREWGNAALAARLCEMLARGGDGAQPLSAEAREELELLRAMARRLAEVHHLALVI